MTYNILWNTSTFTPGIHNIKASATAETTIEHHTYNTGEDAITLNMPAGTYTYNNTITNTGSGHSSGNKNTHTITIRIKETPKLEIISIIIPKPMHINTTQNITLTIKNTGNTTRTVDTEITFLNITQNQSKEIDAGNKTTYTYTIFPKTSDIASHMSKITIRSGPKIIYRELPYTIEQEEQPQPKTRTYTTINYRYNNKTGTITLTGCLKETIQNPIITIGSTTIPLKKDQKNCFNTKLSTTSLDSGSHTLEIKDNNRTLYKKTFTIPEKTPQTTPTGSMLQKLKNSPYAIPLILLVLFVLLLSFMTREKQDE